MVECKDFDSDLVLEPMRIVRIGSKKLNGKVRDLGEYRPVKFLARKRQRRVLAFSKWRCYVVIEVSLCRASRWRLHGCYCRSYCELDSPLLRTFVLGGT